MKKNLIITIFMIITISAFSQTVIPAGNVSGTWNAAGSPYQISGEIIVQSVDLLTIEAGTTVEFQGHFKFIVEGQLLVSGSSAEKVTITAANTVEGWAGLRFSNTDNNLLGSSIIDYCDIEYGKATDISHDGRGGGIYAINSSNLEINNSTICNCSAVENGGGIYLENSDIAIDNLIINANVASGGAGISMQDSEPTITNSIIKNNTATYGGGGLHISNSTVDISFTEITGNSTEGDGGGIYGFNSSVVTLESVTIADNIANQDGSGFANLYKSSFVIINSIVYRNALNNIYNQSLASINATYSLLQFATNENYFGQGCIDTNPLFNADYTLSWSNIPTPDETKSPCIDTGNPNYSDADGTIADMGAYNFTQNGIRGIVTLNGGSGTITDVLITAISATDTTTTSPDAEGNYLLSLGIGTYSIIAELTGYNSLTYDNITVDNQIVIKNFELSPPPPGHIIGKVTIEGIGEITEVVISAGNLTTNPYSVDDPNEPGTIAYYEYTLEISPGSYDVTATLNGYQSQTLQDVIVQASQANVDNDFALELIKYTGTITGKVNLVNGAGNIENVVISCDGSTTNPDINGDYSLELDNGEKIVTASLDGYATVNLTGIKVYSDVITDSVDFALLNWAQITGTQYSTTFYATTSYDGEFFIGGNNNQLAAFGPSGECRGVGVWIEGSHPKWCNYFSLAGYWYVTLVGDNVSGTDPITFKTYNTETSIVEDCDQTFFFPTEPNNDYSDNLTIPSPDHDQTFDLVENWNWISTNLSPANTAITSVFNDLEPLSANFNDLQIKNQTQSSIYDPASGNWVGTLGFVEYPKGYKLNIPSAVTGFTITGKKINPIINPISVSQGYNWISYYPYEEMDLVTAFQSITIPDTSVIKTQTKSAVYYGGWIGDLTTLSPGNAYLLYWHAKIEPSSPVNIIYPLPVEETRNVEPKDVSKTSWNLVGGNENNMIVMAQPNIDSKNISIGLFDAQGKCHSIGTQINDFWYFTVSESSSELEFRKYDNLSGKIINSANSISFAANAILGNPKDPIKIEFRDEDIAINEINVLEQNSPNPFNPTTTIRFQLSSQQPTVLAIYNIKGQKVRTLVNSKLDAGKHSAIWNGKDDSNQSVASGVYFYRLNSGSFDQTSKMLLIK